MAFLDQNGQSYLAWSWGPFDCAGDPALLTDWSGTPTQTYGQGFKDHLTSLGASDTNAYGMRALQARCGESAPARPSARRFRGDRRTPMPHMSAKAAFTRPGLNTRGAGVCPVQRA